MKKNIVIGQAKKHEFNHLVEVIFNKELASDYRREFEVTSNPKHWWKGVTEKITPELMINFLEKKYNDDFIMIRVKGSWKVSTKRNMVICKDLCDALWHVFEPEFLNH